MMKKFVTAIVSILLSLCFFAGCGGGGTGGSGGTSITLLTTGWVNTPISADADDPYRQWIQDNYGLDVTLNATSDFNNTATIAFSSNNKPDLISFPNVTQFNKIRNQGVLIDDWTPYLDKMPNMKAFLMSEDQKFLRELFTDEEGKLTAIWTNPNAITWSLKIREDWANEYRAETVAGPDYPAGATASVDPETGERVPWYPYTPTDLLNFARWIKHTKNSNQNSLDYYGFTTCGGGNSLGVMGTWLPIMWGFHYIPPYGFYMNADGEISFGTLDGTFEKHLEYFKTMVQEQLIDPNWFTQTSTQDTRTAAGKIGIQWQQGILAETTANANPNIDTTGWWKVYNIPDARYDENPVWKNNSDSAIGGVMMNDSLASAIISVSARTALSAEKMDKICALLDDLVCYVDDTKEGAEKYVRGKAYDALRWGVGCDNTEYQEIEGTDFVYVCVKNNKTFRETVAGNGAWDWGAWFSTTNDGVIQGETLEVSEITKVTAQLNIDTAQLPTVLQPGNYLSLDSTAIYNMNVSLVQFQRAYANGESTGFASIADYIEYWKTNNWNTTALSGEPQTGMQMLKEAEAQFRELGITGIMR